MLYLSTKATFVQYSPEIFSGKAWRLHIQPSHKQRVDCWVLLVNSRAFVFRPVACVCVLFGVFFPLWVHFCTRLLTAVHHHIHNYYYYNYYCLRTA